MHQFSFNSATLDDLTQISILLKEEDLPYQDIKAHLVNCLTIRDIERNEIIGFGGFERYQNTGLLRSIVVKKEYRGKKLANALYEKIKKNALALNVNKLYLLTTNKQEFFSRFGFVIINRTEAPTIIQRTKQFSSLCPTSATFMKALL